MARSEKYKEGRTPLHTLRADIDYCHAEALTTYGLIGVKVWITRGELYGKVDLSPNTKSAAPASSSAAPASTPNYKKGGGRPNQKKK